MWSTLQNESQSKYLLPPDVLRVERSFTGVVASYVTENEKICPETRTDDIKNDEFDRKITGESVG